MIRVLVCDGIGTAGRTSNVIDPAVHHLTDDLNERGIETVSEWIDYPAAMLKLVGGNYTWQQSSDMAVKLLIEQFQKYPDDKFVLMAYSGGNKPVHEFLEYFSRFHHQVVSVGFMSDPWRPEKKFQHDTPDPGGFGVCGQDAGPLEDRSFWTSVKGDPISGAAPDSLLRYVGDLGHGTPDQMIRDAIIYFQQGKFQLAAFLGLPFHEWFFGLGARINATAAEVQRYMSGWHTTYYTKPFKTSESDDRSLSVRFGATLSYAVRARI